jgi:UDP-N-acetylglucosamine 2-epimerase (non-hydrolysing)
MNDFHAAEADLEFSSSAASTCCEPRESDGAEDGKSAAVRTRTVLTLFGTRPEIIKLTPVVRAIDSLTALRSVNVNSGQHTDLLQPFLRQFGIRVDRDLGVMTHAQTPSQVCARVLVALDAVLEAERPDLVLVQGDTSTALTGALAAFHRKVPVGHVEAGLRSGDSLNPFPEEMNRRLITRLATYHFAATKENRDNLLAEGVLGDNVFVTGNPVIDSLNQVLAEKTQSPFLRRLLQGTRGMKRLVLTTHRRESFGEKMLGNLRVLRRFVARHPEVVLLFPVHPNPAVREAAQSVLSGQDRIELLEPLDYLDFVGLLASAWLIASDSGGVQEEAPTLGKPVLVLRETTERPEAVAAGATRLAGTPELLESMLESACADDGWFRQVELLENPFGNGDSGKRIAAILNRLLAAD